MCVKFQLPMSKGNCEHERNDKQGSQHYVCYACIAPDCTKKDPQLPVFVDTHNVQANQNYLIFP